MANPIGEVRDSRPPVEQEICVAIGGGGVEIEVCEGVELRSSVWLDRAGLERLLDLLDVARAIIE